MEDSLGVCPYFKELGFCLEPAACDYEHPKMSTAAKPFIPKTKQQKIDNNQTYIQQDMGYEEELPPELPFVEQLKGCTCCKGYINNCDGQACAQLGICFCVADTIHSYNEMVGEEEKVE